MTVVYNLYHIYVEGPCRSHSLWISKSHVSSLKWHINDTANIILRVALCELCQKARLLQNWEKGLQIYKQIMKDDQTAKKKGDHYYFLSIFQAMDPVHKKSQSHCSPLESDTLDNLCKFFCSTEPCIYARFIAQKSLAAFYDNNLIALVKLFNFHHYSVTVSILKSLCLQIH